MVGIKGHPVGVKSYIFDPYESIERGVFFYINPQLWKLKEDPNQKKKRQKRFILALPMIDQYCLDGVLKAKGFEIIQNHLIFDESSTKCTLTGVWTGDSISQSELLENVLTLNNFSNYYRETKDTEIFYD